MSSVYLIVGSLAPRRRQGWRPMLKAQEMSKLPEMLRNPSSGSRTGAVYWVAES